MNTNERDRLITNAIGKKHENAIVDKVRQLNREHRVNILAEKKFEIRKRLDAGNFGVVDLIEHEHKLYAHKTARTNSCEQQRNILKEAIQLSKISKSHPNIPKIHSINLQSLGIIMEYCPGNSLDKFVQDNNSIYSLRDVLNWSCQLADALSFLHSEKTMHRDVKLANLFLKENYQVLVLGDYGTATEFRETMLTIQAGTPITMAPEVCCIKPIVTPNYTECCDIYSWAIVFWQLLAKKSMPYEEKLTGFELMLRVSVENLRPALLKPCPPIFLALITRSWHSKPDQRPTLQFIKKILRLFLHYFPRECSQYTTNLTANQLISSSLDKYRPYPARQHIERSKNLYNEHWNKLRMISQIQQNIDIYENRTIKYEQLQELNRENQRLQEEINRLKSQH